MNQRKKSMFVTTVAATMLMARPLIFAESSQQSLGSNNPGSNLPTNPSSLLLAHSLKTLCWLILVILRALRQVRRGFILIFHLMEVPQV